MITWSVKVMTTTHEMIVSNIITWIHASIWLIWIYNEFLEPQKLMFYCIYNNFVELRFEYFGFLKYDWFLLEFSYDFSFDIWYTVLNCIHVYKLSFVKI